MDPVLPSLPELRLSGRPFLLEAPVRGVQGYRSAHTATEIDFVHSVIDSGSGLVLWL